MPFIPGLFVLLMAGGMEDINKDHKILNELLAGLAPVRFDPVFVNAQAGVTFRF